MEFELTLQAPWELPHSPDGLALELNRELSPDHPLFAKKVRAIAVRQDRDEVLFEVNELDRISYAVVHLTWTGHHERGAWPKSSFFETLEDAREQILADHIEFECLD